MIAVRRSKSPGLCVTVLTLSLATGAIARADIAASTTAGEMERQAAARALFQEGLAHADARRWPEAADRFARARALRTSPEITYNLATALLRLGRLVHASELLRQVSEDTAASGPVREAAGVRLSQTLPRLAHLTVHPPVAGGEVLLNGRPLAPAMLGVALPVDPLEHAVEVRRGEQVVAARRLALREGERRTVAFDLMGAPSASRDQPRDAPEPPKTGRRWWLWTTLGVVLVGGAIAAGAAATAARNGPRDAVETWSVGGR